MCIGKQEENPIQNQFDQNLEESESSDNDHDNGYRNIYELIDPEEFIFVCKECYSPVTERVYIEGSISEQGENVTVAVLIKRKNLFIYNIEQSDTNEAWKTRVNCADCNNLLSFIEVEINENIKIFKSNHQDELEKIVLVNREKVLYGKAKNFQQAYLNNEI